MTLEIRPDRHKIMAGLNQLIGPNPPLMIIGSPAVFFFHIIELVNIDTACTSWNLISDVFNSI